MIKKIEKEKSPFAKIFEYFYRDRMKFKQTLGQTNMNFQ